MKKTIMLLIVTFAVACMLLATDGKKEHYGNKFPPMEHHQGHKMGHEMNPHKMGDHFMIMMKELDLSEYQREEMKEIRSEHRKVSIQKQADIDILEVDFRTSMSNQDFQAAKKITGDIFSIKMENAITQIDLHEQIWKLLDSDQRDKLEELMRERPLLKEKGHYPKK